MRSSRLGESDGIAAEVIDRVVLAEEDISNDPDGAERRGDVEAGKGADAGACARQMGAGQGARGPTLDLEDVVLRRELVGLAAKVKGEGRERGDSFALDGVGAVPALLRADLLVDDLSNVRRERDERGSCAGQRSAMQEGTNRCRSQRPCFRAQASLRQT